MEHKILEFIEECQNHMGQFQDVIQLEEVTTQLINIIYFLFEKIDQLKEENSLGLENIQNELNQLQLLYRNQNREFEEQQSQYQRQILICEQLEEKLQQREIQLEQEKDQEQLAIKRDNRDMLRSLQMQQQYIDSVIQKSENQQTEIKELVLKIEKLSRNRKQQSSSKAISPKANYQSNIITSENQIIISQQQSSQNSQVSLQPIYEDQGYKNSKTHLFHFTHSKNQSLNWCQLATITQTLRSVTQSQSTSQNNIEKLNLADELKKVENQQKNENRQLHLSSFANQQIIKQENPYFDFFILISQSVKLDLNKTEYYSITVDQLFDQFIKQAIPFNKWYHEIKQFILNHQDDDF